MRLQEGIFIALLCAAGAQTGCSDEAKPPEASAAGGESGSSGEPDEAASGEPSDSQAGGGGTATTGGGASQGGSTPTDASSVPLGSLPWPADGGAPTAYELLLPAGCELFPLPPKWTGEQNTKVLGRCGHAISSIPLDGSEVTTIAEVTGGLEIVSADPERVVYLESEFLKSATVDGEESVTLATDVKVAEASPDRSRVVYAAPHAETGDLALYSVASAGGEPALLSESLYYLNLLDQASDWWFTADSELVWFTNAERQLAVVPVAGGTVLQHVSGPREEAEHVWAEDGRTIAFRDVDESAEPIVRVLSADSATPQDIALPEDLYAYSVQISPQGDQVLLMGYTKTADRRWAALATDVDGGPWRELAMYDRLTELGFVGSQRDQVLLTAMNGEASPLLLEVPLSGGTPKKLGTLSSLCDYMYLPAQVLPGLSTDGRTLAFKDSVGALVLADLDVANSEVIIEAAAALTRADLCTGALLSPDSNRIALLSCVLTACRAAVVDTTGELLATDPGAGSVGFSFSPDSSLLEHHNGYTVRVLSIDDNEVKYVHQNGGGSVPDEVWIDGRRVVTPAPYGSGSTQQIVLVP
ncbi:MAG: hypothetical protein EOO73_19555 [Myxococcales bacterium]|nr:MAG: hypothetical protein EOO73_19555 [Myxococcales bacterium]